MRVLAAGFEAPWELTWGPDNFLWVTEKVGKRVDRINPADGSKTTVLTINEVSASGAQDGLLGLAFAGPSAYLAYSYDADPGPPASLRGKIVRYQYDRAAATLTNPVDILAGLPAGEDHNAGRLLIGPDQNVYYSIGELGNNQFDRACEPIRAQDLPTAQQVDVKDWSTYQLRLAIRRRVPGRPVLPVLELVRRAQLCPAEIRRLRGARLGAPRPVGVAMAGPGLRRASQDDLHRAGRTQLPGPGLR